MARIAIVAIMALLSLTGSLAGIISIHQSSSISSPGNVVSSGEPDYLDVAANQDPQIQTSGVVEKKKNRKYHVTFAGSPGAAADVKFEWGGTVKVSFRGNGGTSSYQSSGRINLKIVGGNVISCSTTSSGGGVTSVSTVCIARSTPSTSFVYGNVGTSQARGRQDQRSRGDGQVSTRPAGGRPESRASFPSRPIHNPPNSGVIPAPAPPIDQRAPSRRRWRFRDLFSRARTRQDGTISQSKQ